MYANKKVCQHFPEKVIVDLNEKKYNQCFWPPVKDHEGQIVFWSQKY